MIQNKEKKKKKSAEKRAEELFEQRQPDTFMRTPMNFQTGKEKRKRHLIRFVAYEYPQRAVDPFPSQLVCGARVVDQVCLRNNGEWWVYVKTDEAIAGHALCSMIHSHELGAMKGCFYTDSFPWARNSIKSYDYTRIHHFKMLLERLRRVWE